jgi:hypothetical protein
MKPLHDEATLQKTLGRLAMAPAGSSLEFDFTGIGIPALSWRRQQADLLRAYLGYEQGFVAEEVPCPDHENCTRIIVRIKQGSK